MARSAKLKKPARTDAVAVVNGDDGVSVLTSKGNRPRLRRLAVMAAGSAGCTADVESCSSARARSDHTLLAKSDPAPQPREWRFADGQRRFCQRAGHELTRWAEQVVFVGTRMSSRKLSTLRVCDADDGTANRTPSAWMISLATFFAHGQIGFFVWVDFGERKWSILAERRRVAGKADG